MLNVIHLFFGSFYYVLNKKWSIYDPKEGKQSKKCLYYKDGVPKYIRVFDNGGTTMDRFTVMFSRKKANDREYLVLKLSEHPDDQFHNRYTILVRKLNGKSIPLIGVRIDFREMPAQCKTIVLQYYRELWENTSNFSR